MASSSMGKLLRRRSLSSMPYSNCQTRVVDLTLLDIPERASDREYQQIYQTYIQRLDENARHLRDAIESIKYGIAPPVAFPTETVYGLGADARNEPAVAGIFAAKGRPSDNPLIVHVASSSHLERVIDEPIPDVYRPLVEHFWPGPLTILLPVPKQSTFAKNVHPGQHTIGFRMPSSKYARFFIAATDRPIAGPSANSSGKPSPTTAHHVLDDLKGKVNFILDGGPCPVGVESTVVDGLHDPPLILRPGGVSREELLKLGGVWAHTAIGYETHSHSSSAASTPQPQQNGFVADMNGAPRAPGMKYRHYTPKGRLILFSPLATKNGRVSQIFHSLVKPAGKEGKIRVGFLSRTWGFKGGLDVDGEEEQMEDFLAKEHIDSSNWLPHWQDIKCEHTDTHTIFETTVANQDPKEGAITELAKELFALLRLFDDLDCDYIFAETVERSEAVHLDERVVDAVADRLEKAAAERIDE